VNEPTTDDDDDIVAVLLFDSDEELDKWLANKGNLQHLKQLYSPRLHRCILNKAARLVTVRKGRGGE
jgi:hypothetical protein